MQGTYDRLGVHVSATPLEVLRAARKKIHPLFRTDRDCRDKRHHFFRMMLRYHRDWQKLCNQFRM